MKLSAPSKLPHKQPFRHNEQIANELLDAILVVLASPRLYARVAISSLLAEWLTLLLQSARLCGGTDGTVRQTSTRLQVHWSPAILSNALHMSVVVTTLDSSV